jgi:hypothetical protein
VQLEDTLGRMLPRDLAANLAKLLAQARATTALLPELHGEAEVARRLPEACPGSDLRQILGAGR